MYLRHLKQHNLVQISGRTFSSCQTSVITSSIPEERSDIHSTTFLCLQEMEARVKQKAGYTAKQCLNEIKIQDSILEDQTCLSKNVLTLVFIHHLSYRGYNE